MLDYTGIDSEVQNPQPVTFELLQNFPNPFNPVTTIPFSIPTWNQRPAVNKQRMVSLTIYDARGQRIRALDLDPARSGIHEIVWDGRDANGRDMASGVYFYRLFLGHGQWSGARKMILMR